ncbi:hypothetical protein AB0K80_21785 [Streptomyces sp. NPDC052682]|uniref:hypothetical protein n=1 Tax=Streptomyces sp. NPDC052682 TaxID=3154954 RepID=UPI003442384F
MDAHRDRDNLLGPDDTAGRAVAATGLWIALIASLALVVVGLFGMVAGLTPAIWVSVVGVVLSLGTAVAMRARSG